MVLSPIPNSLLSRITREHGAQGGMTTIFGNSKMGEELGPQGNFNKAQAQPMLLRHSRA